MATNDNKVQKGLGTCAICGKPLFKDYDGSIGGTCKAHQGKLRQNADESSAAPEGWLRMSLVCRKAVEVGLTIGSVVKASGGDACVDPLLDPIFRVTYVGKAKFMNPLVVTQGFNMLKASRVDADKPVGKVSKVEAEVSNQLKQAVKK